MSLIIRADKELNFTNVYLCQYGYQIGANWGWYYHAVKEAWPQMVEKLKKYLRNFNQ